MSEQLMTKNDYLLMYQQFPGALALEIGVLFKPISGSEGVGIHNHISRKILALCDDHERLVMSLAQAVIDNIHREGPLDGKEKGR